MLALRRAMLPTTSTNSRGALMEVDGRLGKDGLTVSDREFAAGDRVVCLRNSDRLGVIVNREKRTLTIATDRGTTVEVSRAYLAANNLRHAYALTGHAAQGLTVERAFVLGSGEGRLGEWGDVALSRAIQSFCVRPFLLWSLILDIQGGQKVPTARERAGANDQGPIHVPARSRD